MKLVCSGRSTSEEGPVPRGLHRVEEELFKVMRLHEVVPFINDGKGGRRRDKGGAGSAGGGKVEVPEEYFW